MDQKFTNTYWYDSFPEFFQSIRFCYKKKWYDLSGWKIYVIPIIRTRINAKKSNYPAKMYFVVMIFQKRRRYPYDLFIPQEYFSFKNIKLMRRNEIILPKLILLLWYFINQEVIQFFLVIPESFLTLILCPFWHEHTCSVSYQKDPGLFDSFKIPHQDVYQVYPKINFFLGPSRVSTIKLTYAPAGKGDNYPLCCDDKLRSLFATWTSGGFVTVVARNGLKTIQGLD